MPRMAWVAAARFRRNLHFDAGPTERRRHGFLRLRYYTPIKRHWQHKKRPRELEFPKWSEFAFLF